MIATSSDDRPPTGPDTPLLVSVSTAWEEEALDGEAAPAWLPDESDCETWLRAGLRLLEPQPPYSISLRFATARESATLNNTYRQKDAPTNVLSFPAALGAAEEAWPQLASQQEAEFLGDLVLCPSVVAGEASAQGKAVADHWAHLLLHGLFHLAGYDHIDQAEAEEMEALEIEALRSLGIANPYLID